MMNKIELIRVYREDLNIVEKVMRMERKDEADTGTLIALQSPQIFLRADSNVLGGKVHCVADRHSTYH